MSLPWIIALPEAIRHLCSVVYRIMRDCTVAYRHMVGHSCGSSRKVFGDCLDCQGSLSQCARKRYTKVQKKPFSDKMREKALEKDSFCAIIAQGIQVSRVPSQIRYICRGLLLQTDCRPKEEAVGLILLYRTIISLLWKYCKVFSKRN